MRRTFLFTDIVRSTPLVEALGDDAWADLLSWHDATLREHFAAHGGQEVDHAGGGFFVAFETPAAAVQCAVAVQSGLAAHRRSAGFAPQVRIGIHAEEALGGDDGYRGHGVHVAARVGAAAGAGEILVSAGTLDGAGAEVETGTPRTARLKGSPRPWGCCPSCGPEPGAANSSPVAGAMHRRQPETLPPAAGAASDPRSEAR